MTKKNVVLIYTDQMRYDACSFAGNTISHTPALDHLAQESICFTRAYSSFPLCCPFRASLMTGKYAHQTGVYTNHYPIPLGQTFLPEVLEQSGYHTGWFGKWHLNGGEKFAPVPQAYQLGFSEFIGYSRGHHSLHSVYYHSDNPTPYRSQTFEPVYQTDQLIDFIERASSRGQPFFGALCYGLPHPPLDLAPKQYTEMYHPDEIIPGSLVPPWEADWSRRYLAKYYGLVRCVDDQIARLTAWLKANGRWEDTVLIFVSDHGDLCGEHGLRHKSSFHDAAAHVPFLVHASGFPARIISQGVDPSVSLMPTILALCELPIPPSVQGDCLMTLMQDGTDAKLNDALYYQLLGVSEAACAVLDRQEHKRYPERGLRTADWLYVERCAVPVALYHLRADPEEQYNLVCSVDQLERVAYFRARLQQRMHELGDRWEIGAQHPPENYQTHADADARYHALYARAIFEKPR